MILPPCFGLVYFGHNNDRIETRISTVITATNGYLFAANNCASHHRFCLDKLKVRPVNIWLGGKDNILQGDMRYILINNPLYHNNG